MEYARVLRDHPERAKGKKVKTPAVVGAVIDLGYCLNLLETNSLNLVKKAHQTLKESLEKVGEPLPTNRDVHGSQDLLLRFLDRAVIESLHSSRKEEAEPFFDSVRAVFPEGEQLYSNAGFRSHSHIQICIRNPNCIKGYFRVLSSLRSHDLPRQTRDAQSLA